MKSSASWITDQHPLPDKTKDRNKRSGLLFYSRYTGSKTEMSYHHYQLFLVRSSEISDGDLCKKALLPTTETPTQIFGCFRFKYPPILPKHPLNPSRIPDNQASGPPFRLQQAHLACWPLSTGSNTSPSDGFAHSLYTDQNRLLGRSGIYGAAYRSFVRPHNGSSTNIGCVWFALPSADDCGGLCA